MNKITIKYCVAVAILWIAAAFCGCGDKDAGIIEISATGGSPEVTAKGAAPEGAEKEEPDRSAAPGEKSSASAGTVRVYVCGAVMYPDVYSLDSDMRMIDAVKAAGGFRYDAAGDYINLASKLEDGQKIYIPTNDEVEEAFAAGLVQSGQESVPEQSGKVNINTADKAKLMTLPGVGESKADRIIDYRQQNGGFSSPEDIMLVAGIKEGMYNKIKELICTE